MFTAMLMASLFSGISAQTFDEPVEYINFFSQEFEVMYDLQLEYSSFLVHTSDDQVNIKGKELNSATQKIHDKFQGVTAYENDRDIKANAVAVLDKMLEISNTDYFDQAAKKAGCLDCFATILERTKMADKDNKVLGKAMDKLVKSIDDFAADNNITMEEGDKERESLLGKINRINDYITELDLAVLEVQYASTAIIDALNAEDPAKAKELVKELSKATANASKRLKKVERIKEDATAIGQAERLIGFHKDGIKNIYGNMVGAFDKKGQIINSKVDAYNKASNKLNQGVNTWNNKYQSAKFNLQQRHVPKPKQQYKRS
jgi:hypothetical protein